MSKLVTLITCLITVFAFQRVPAQVEQRFKRAAEPMCNLDPGRVAEELVNTSHKLDSLNLLLFLFLLVLTILTIWLFKQHRFRFLHETGLAMIYGVVIGAVVWYTAGGKQRDPTEATMCHREASCDSDIDAPNQIYLQLDYPNDSNVIFSYQRDKVVKSDLPESVSPFAEKVSFDPEFFFNVILPPIIFYAGYSLKRRHFFRNLGSIMAFAFIGTCISALVVGTVMYVFVVLVMNSDTGFSLQDCFFFGSLISATDPVTVLAVFHDLHVDVDMYILVFGESVLNDAVAIVLTRTIDGFQDEQFTAAGFFKAVGTFAWVFIGSFLIGALMGCITALLTKFTHLRDFPLLETALFVLMSYMSYLFAEAASLTGIVAVLFCGVTQAHYTYNNLSEESKRRTKEFFELLNFLAESFIFSYMGLSMFNPDNQHWNVWFILAAFFGIFLGRFLNIYPLSFLLNLGRKNKIPFNVQHMLMFSGLRGAIAFALAIRNSATAARQESLTATLMIVLVTVVVFGGMTTQMLTWLNIRVGVDEDDSAPTGALHTVGTVGYHPVSNNISEQESRVRKRKEQAFVVRRWYDFDYKFMKPILTKKGADLRELWPSWCLPLAEKLTVLDDQPTEDSDTDFILEEESNGFSHSPSDSNNIAQDPASSHGEDTTLDGDLGLGDHQLAVRGLTDPPPSIV